MMDISDNLHLSDLSVDEQRIMKALYEHQRKADASQNWRVYARTYVMVEEALSPEWKVEQSLFQKGLACRSPRNEGYAYAISFDGYEWYQREAILFEDRG